MSLLTLLGGKRNHDQRAGCKSAMAYARPIILGKREVRMHRSNKRDGSGISRRTLMQGASALAGFSALNFLAPRASLGQDSMTRELVASFWSGFSGDVMREEVAKPFERETGVRVHVGSTSNA